MGESRAGFACVVLSDAEGRGVVDERRTEKADRVARYQADWQGDLATMLLVPQTVAATWRVIV